MREIHKLEQSPSGNTCEKRNEASADNKAMGRGQAGH
jgi:hypothetical protein